MSESAAKLGPLEASRSTDPFGDIACPVLRESFVELAAELPTSWAPSSESEASFNGDLARLALYLDAASDGNVLSLGSPQERGLGIAEEVQILAALRKKLFDRWRRKSIGVDPDRILELLYAIDRLAEERSPRATGDVKLRMGEPDAFRLLEEVAHDIRSPLTSILFLSEAMRNGHSGSHTDLQKNQLGLIYSAALGLTGVANDLMTAAQDPESGEFEASAAFSLTESFESVREMVLPMADVKEIELRFAVNCYGHRLGHMGPLGRVLMNLTTNAIRFTEEGGLVEVLAKPIGRETVEISVRDTGRGIPPKALSRLFEPFQKSHNREGHFFAASGLGLSIVRRLLERMDSELKVRSVVGEGTCFSFELRLPTPH